MGKYNDRLQQWRGVFARGVHRYLLPARSIHHQAICSAIQAPALRLLRAPWFLASLSLLACPALSCPVLPGLCPLWSLSGSTWASSTVASMVAVALLCCVCVCVCVWERESVCVVCVCVCVRERECVCCVSVCVVCVCVVCVCVCVCVCVGGGGGGAHISMCVLCVCVCVCVCLYLSWEQPSSALTNLSTNKPQVTLNGLPIN